MPILTIEEKQRGLVLSKEIKLNILRSNSQNLNHPASKPLFKRKLNS